MRCLAACKCCYAGRHAPTAAECHARTSTCDSLHPRAVQVPLPPWDGPTLQQTLAQRALKSGTLRTVAQRAPPAPPPPGGAAWQGAHDLALNVRIQTRRLGHDYDYAYRWARGLGWEARGDQSAGAACGVQHGWLDGMGVECAQAACTRFMLRVQAVTQAVHCVAWAHACPSAPHPCPELFRLQCRAAWRGHRRMWRRRMRTWSQTRCSATQTTPACACRSPRFPALLPPPPQALRARQAPVTQQESQVAAVWATCRRR